MQHVDAASTTRVMRGLTDRADRDVATATHLDGQVATATHLDGEVAIGPDLDGGHDAEDGSLVTEYGLLAVVAATIAGVVITWASSGALVTLFNALLRQARTLVGA